MEGWQQRALQVYKNVGEVNFSAKFYARMLARIRIFPVEINEDGTQDAIESGVPMQLLDRIQDPGGGRKRIQYDYGRLMMVTGEGALFGSYLETDRERWRFLWRQELITDPSTKVTYRRDAKGQRSNESGVAYRMWTPSPENSWRADSPLRGVLDVADELVLLTAAVRATAVSRMLNGMLLMPSEISPPPAEVGDDEDPQVSPFLQMLTKHLQAQLDDPSSAAAKSPFLLEAAYEYLDQVRWMQMHDPQSDYLERDLRIEAIKRVGLGMDMPPEALEGFSNTNHWAAQQIQWDMWRSHGVPIADQFVTDLNQVYLRPALMAAGEDPTNIGIGYDDSLVVISPDQTAVADQAMDRAAISFEGYRKMKGIPEDYKPSEDEQKFVFGLKTRDATVAGLEEQAPPVHGPTAPPQVSPTGLSNVPPQPTDGRVVSRQEARVASIVGAANLAIRQCRAKAGARLRQRTRNCDQCQQDIDKMENALVASTLGIDALRIAGMNDPIALVQGGTADFRSMLQEWGIDDQNSGVLCERVEAFAAQTLFDMNTPEVPPGFAAHVEHALEVADRHAVVS
ncbi:MAG TPA: hypothetical protein VGF24_37390 [Vicinamibacterales bacterium]|jgi:hypothetical protein